jgi:hypothetical protein
MILALKGTDTKSIHLLFFAVNFFCSSYKWLRHGVDFCRIKWKHSDKKNSSRGMPHCVARDMCRFEIYVAVRYMSLRHIFARDCVLLEVTSSFYRTFWGWSVQSWSLVISSLCNCIPFWTERLCSNCEHIDTLLITCSDWGVAEYQDKELWLSCDQRVIMSFIQRYLYTLLNTYGLTQIMTLATSFSHSGADRLHKVMGTFYDIPFCFIELWWIRESRMMLNHGHGFSADNSAVFRVLHC